VSVVDRYAGVQVRESIYQFVPFELSDGERVLRRDGRLMSMPPKAFTVLSVLVKAKGKVVSKAMLLAAVWPDTFVEEGVLTQTMSILRRRLSTRRAEESPIETISRVGYRLRLPVSEIEGAYQSVTTAAIEDAAGETACVPPASPVPQVIQQGNTGTSFVLFEERHSARSPKSTLMTVVVLACLVTSAIFAFFYQHASQVTHRQATYAQSGSDLTAFGVAFPRNEQAKRLYIEGVRKLWSWDSVASAYALEASLALEPDFALSHSELAHAVTLLGQSDRALQEANRGSALAANLSHIDQLRIQAMREAAEHRFEAAAATYATLFALVPSDLEYARSQASLLENAGHSKEAINLLEPLVTAPTQDSVTAASELVIGQAYSNVGDYPAAQKWAERAEEDAKNQGDIVLCERALTAGAYARALPRVN
jgi:DNA-binding winged helix-turn-helix (wHTH) protein